MVPQPHTFPPVTWLLPCLRARLVFPSENQISVPICSVICSVGENLPPPPTMWALGTLPPTSPEPLRPPQPGEEPLPGGLTARSRRPGSSAPPGLGSHELGVEARCSWLWNVNRGWWVEMTEGLGLGVRMPALSLEVPLKGCLEK